MTMILTMYKILKAEMFEVDNLPVFENPGLGGYHPENYNRAHLLLRGSSTRASSGKTWKEASFRQ